MTLSPSSTPTLAALALLVAPACNLNTLGIDITTGPSGITTASSIATTDGPPVATAETAPTDPGMSTDDSTNESETYQLVDTEMSPGSESSTSTSGDPHSSTSGDPSTTREPSTGSASSTGAPGPCDDACGGDTPVCNLESDTCVGCLHNADCAVDQPICGPEHTCAPCDDHSQCSVGACDLESGQCMPDSCVYYVNTGLFACSDAADGKTPMAPLCKLHSAVSLLQPGKPCTIKLGSDNYPYLATIPEGDYTVAIVPYADASPLLPSPALKVQAGNKVYMRDLAIGSENYINIGLECRYADLWLDRLRIFGYQYNQGSAMHADNCRVRVRQSTITGMSRGGLDIEGDDVEASKLWLENTYLTLIDGNASFGALRLQGAVEAGILYTTAANVTGPVPMINCLPGFSGGLGVRNSAIVGPAPRFAAACDPEIEDSYDSTNPGNLFSSYDYGQLKASVGGPLKDVAEWLAPSDPAVDQDGTLRPTVNHGLDYAGADRP